MRAESAVARRGGPVDMPASWIGRVLVAAHGLPPDRTGGTPASAAAAAASAAMSGPAGVEVSPVPAAASDIDAKCADCDRNALPQPDATAPMPWL